MLNELNAMPKAVEDCHALLAWIIPKLDDFPRNRRFTWCPSSCLGTHRRSSRFGLRIGERYR